jgi:hypothetical protein
MESKIERVFIYKGYTCFIMFMSCLPYAWYNGYVVLPEGHKFNGVFYDNIDVDVHGGLTFSKYASKYINSAFEKRGSNIKISKKDYTIGFDCNHYQDNVYKCNQKYVENQIKNLVLQIENKPIKLKNENKR